jgi:putative oxygen-independent coproporphyrinogen III oxidase
MTAVPPLALYVHMPWCVRKCPYCDFNSHQLKSAQPPGEYIDALIRDFEAETSFTVAAAAASANAGAGTGAEAGANVGAGAHAAAGVGSLVGAEAGAGSRPIETVFFGGGTPSLFSPQEIARLLAALRERAPFAPGAEITLEANPGTIERGRFEGYLEAGVTRVSLGAQSFAARALEWLGRIHGPDDTHRAVEELRTAGFENFNLDLMYALPEQTLDEALEDVRIACDLGAAHISHYQLALEPGTVFHAQPPPLPDEEAALEMQNECQALLAARGFEQYEVSAYARPGARCRHNLNYWRFGDYLGIGAGAHGKITLGVPDHILRTEKPRQPREYLRGVEALDARTGARGRLDDGDDAGGGGGEVLRVRRALGTRRSVPRDELAFEFMLNALRLNEGFDLEDFAARTGLAYATIQPTLERARDRGLAESTGSGWRATELGRRFLNDLQAGFLA